MNKVFNINLGGQPLTIDEDAYRILENYLQSLHNHFRKSEGYEEIMSDIEARLGELVREGMGKRAIVMIQDVKNTVSIMGKPEEFGAEPMDETQKTSKNAQNAQNTEGGQSAAKSAKKPPIQTGKHLFRDEETKVLGGVCSGLAAYFGIEEIIWVRLAVLILGSSGVGFFFYILMWIIVPAAKTTADRLAMRGEPIDVNSIAKSIETGFEDLSKKVNDFGQDTEAHTRFGKQFSNGINAVGIGIGSVLKNLGGVAKFLAAMISIVIIVGIVISWIAAAVGLTWAAPVASYLTDESWEAGLAVVSGFIFIAVPTLALVFFVRRLLFKRGVHDAVHFVIWTIWAINSITMAYLGANFGKNFTYSVDKTQTYNLSNVVDTLNIAVMGNPKNNINTQFGSLRVSEEFLLSEDVTLFIHPSTGTEFELSQVTKSEGRTTEEAKTLLSRMNYTPSVSGNKLTVPAEFVIPKGSKWRGQVIDMTLKVPIGKVFRMTEAEIDAWRVIDIDEAEGERQHSCYGERIQTWRMTEEGAVCINAEKNKKRKTVKEDEE
ncbi:MAG: PspC domain-containing protein [Saprospiraceae bacterium]|nr:PspC domain-containing protein [Saprospiraceae bacterium]